MGLLEELSSKASGILNKYPILNPLIKRQSSIYDASLNTIIVANIPLIGVVSSSISAESVLKQEQGIDVTYTTHYETFDIPTLTVSLLPTSPSNKVLTKLRDAQQKSKGWFSLSVHENGVIVGHYKAYILSMPQKDMQVESSDMVYTFSLNSLNPSRMDINEIPPSVTQQESSQVADNPVSTGQANGIAQDSQVIPITKVTQAVENSNNVAVTVLENKPVGDNLVQKPKRTN